MRSLNQFSSFEIGSRDKLIFTAMGRVNRIDDEMCRALLRLNTKSLSFGLESGSNRVLKYLKKEDIDVADSMQAISLCKKHGIDFTGSFVFGSPSETIEEMKETVQFIKWLVKNGASTLTTFIMTPFPDTPFWSIAEKRGKVGTHMNWELLNYENVETPVLLDEHIDISEFKRIYMEGKRAVHSNEIKYWLNIFRHDPYYAVKYVLKNKRNVLKFLFSAGYKRGQPEWNAT